jgi:hypothetical protein
MEKQMSEKKQWETRDMSGSAFLNKYKQKESQPDYKGDIRVRGELLKISAWQRQTRSGDVYFTYSVEPKDESLPQQTKPPVEQQAPQQPVMDDDVPF